MLVMLKDAAPLLVKVTDCAVLVVPTAWLLNVRLVLDKLTAGAPLLVPVPVNVIDCGLPLALSVMLILPVRVPVAVGEKVTLMLQLAPAANEAPQVWVCA